VEAKEDELIGEEGKKNTQPENSRMLEAHQIATGSCETLGRGRTFNLKYLLHLLQSLYIFDL
jgi:hypothetical protein